MYFQILIKPSLAHKKLHSQVSSDLEARGLHLAIRHLRKRPQTGVFAVTTVRSAMSPYSTATLSHTCMIFLF
ncbi:hypothetical protein X801_08643 [Opisthorchis viverrini]|uniref:Uncharacterized protein n=1 Tax=Opisthorchis viverrini TaxID=6198 RepID=A0A1S8WM74_OPIVI|nr:hypothetical protein X801_08643 [Opisthorchis viverrini]